MMRVNNSHNARTAKKQIKTSWNALLLAALFIFTHFTSLQQSYASSRIKDLVSFEGVRDNQLVGYGLVVGLNGTGDSLRNAPFTQQSIVAMLERLGVSTRGTNMKTENTAAVMITATLPAFGRLGSKIDITISSLGDADDLRGGTLIVTPLLGADGEVYAVAQGSVQIAGFSAGGAGASVTQGVPTAGRIPNGAIIEKEVPFNFNDKETLKISLRNPDFTTAKNIALTINKALGGGTANPLDPSTVEIKIPDVYSGNMFSLISQIEQFPVQVDQRARVVIDERSGIIVIGKDVKVSEVAIAQGNLTIKVTETPQVSQPGAFSGGKTAVVPGTEITIDESNGTKLALLNPGVNLQELVDGLNALGISPRDMISILQALKASGALQAELEIM
jgi:flagellar P-ring protein precursor FlgI